MAISPVEFRVPSATGARPHGDRVVFFGNNLGVECQRCGAYNQTSNGHKFCAHITCPIALREVQRRRRKRTSALEKRYMPSFLGRSAKGAGEADGEPADAG